MTVLEKLRLTPSAVDALCIKLGITTKPHLTEADLDLLFHHKGAELRARRKYTPRASKPE